MPTVDTALLRLLERLEAGKINQKGLQLWVLTSEATISGKLVSNKESKFKFLQYIGEITNANTKQEERKDERPNYIHFVDAIVISNGTEMKVSLVRLPIESISMWGIMPQSE